MQGHGESNLDSFQTRDSAKSNSHSNVGRFTWRRIGREKFPLSLNIIAQTLELELD